MDKAEAGPSVVSVVAFAAYSIIFQAIIWGIFGYAVFGNGYSGWWILVAVLCSSSQLKPDRFGIPSKECPTTEKPV